ncbi:MAG: hypothetical protein ACI8S6_000014 [Myxococcota bacterium]|jgi:hypothetical protein
MRSGLLAVLLIGCSSNKFEYNNTSCNDSFLGWSGNLSTHLYNGEKDGSFDYAPAGAVLRRVVGKYNLDNGKFSWSTTFNSNHYMASRDVEGYGYANTNGNLDVEYTVTAEDIAGESSTVSYRERRIGCDVEELQDVEGTIVSHTGVFTAKRYTWDELWDSEGTEGTASGEDFSDHTYTTERLYPGYEHTETGDRLAGTAEREWLQEGSDYDYVGTTEYRLDGSQHEIYSGEDNGSVLFTWDYEIDYFGTGTGTYTEGSTSCDIAFDEGDCSYDCGGGSTGSCN